MKFIPFFILLSLFILCNKTFEPNQKPNPIDPVFWIDEHTLYISSTGEAPFPKKDASADKIFSCQNARERAIEIFHDRFLQDKKEQKYFGRKYNDEFHHIRMEISTISKLNDEKGNCKMIMSFKGKELKKRLTDRVKAD